MSLQSTFSGGSIRGFRIVPSSLNGQIQLENFKGWNFWYNGVLGVLERATKTFKQGIYYPVDTIQENGEYPETPLGQSTGFSTDGNVDDAETKKIENAVDFELKTISINVNSWIYSRITGLFFRRVNTGVWIDNSAGSLNPIFYSEVYNYDPILYDGPSTKKSFYTGISIWRQDSSAEFGYTNGRNWWRICAISSEIGGIIRQRQVDRYSTEKIQTAPYAKRLIVCGDTNSEYSNIYKKEFTNWDTCTFGHSQNVFPGYTPLVFSGNVCDTGTIYTQLAVNESQYDDTLTNIAQVIRKIDNSGFEIKVVQLYWDEFNFNNRYAYYRYNSFPGTQDKIRQIGQTLSFTNVTACSINSGPQRSDVVNQSRFSTVGLRICVTDKTYFPTSPYADQNGMVRTTSVWEMAGTDHNTPGTVWAQFGNSFFTGQNDQYTKINYTGKSILADSVNSLAAIYECTEENWQPVFTFPQEIGGKHIAKWNGLGTAVLVFEYTPTAGQFSVYKNDGGWAKFGVSFPQLAEDIGTLPTTMAIDLNCTKMYTVFVNSGKRLYSI